MDREKNIFKRFRAFLRDVRGEMKKVTWPTKADLYKTTLAVIISSLFFGVYLFAADFVFAWLKNRVVDLFK